MVKCGVPGLWEHVEWRVPDSGRGIREGFLEEVTSKLRCDSKRGTPEPARAEVSEFCKKSGRYPLSYRRPAQAASRWSGERPTPPAVLAGTGYMSPSLLSQVSDLFGPVKREPKTCEFLSTEVFRAADDWPCLFPLPW